VIEDGVSPYVRQHHHGRVRGEDGVDDAPQPDSAEECDHLVVAVEVILESIFCILSP